MGLIVQIGRFTIEKNGVTCEVFAMRKKKNKDGEYKRNDDGSIYKEKTRLASHGFLSWCFDTAIRVGNKAEKAEAKKHLDILKGKFGEIVEKDNDKYMDAYRVIERKYISNGFK